jgi:hypothetical protein
MFTSGIGSHAQCEKRAKACSFLTRAERARLCHHAAGERCVKQHHEEGLQDECADQSEWHGSSARRNSADEAEQLPIRSGAAALPEHRACFYRFELAFQEQAQQSRKNFDNKGEDKNMGRTQTMPNLDAPSATGTPLPHSLRHSLESLHSRDLSAVRVHEGHEAVHLGAQAFVRGTDIYFAPGQMPPPIVAHEAWHVVQQVSQPPRVAVANGVQENNDAPPLAEGLVEVE